MVTLREQLVEKRRHQTRSVKDAIAVKFQPPMYAVFYEVANGVGANYRRYVDALVMSLFPSRGLDLIGLEVKVTRGDWLKERRSPHKADSIAAYCDFWYIVTDDPTVAKPEELPEPWGLFVLKGNGLNEVKKPTRLQPLPLDRPIVAAILRRADQSVRRKIDQDERIEQARKEGYEAGERSVKRQRMFRVQDGERAIKTVKDFEERSGLSMNDWNAGEIGDVVARLRRHGDFSREADRMERLASELDQEAKDLKTIATQFREFKPLGKGK